MSEKDCNVYMKNYCLNFWDFVHKWEDVPTYKLEKIINDYLPLYENIMTVVEYADSLVLHLKRYDRDIAIRDELGIKELYYCDGTRLLSLLEKDVKRIDREGKTPKPRLFFLCADVERVEQEHKEFLTSDVNTNQSNTRQVVVTLQNKICELKENIATLQKENNELQTENESLKSTITKLEKELVARPQIDADERMARFWKEYPLIALVANMHNEGLPREKIVWRLTKDHPLTNIQAAVLCAKDTSRRDRDALEQFTKRRHKEYQENCT